MVLQTYKWRYLRCWLFWALFACLSPQVVYGLGGDRRAEKYKNTQLFRGFLHKLDAIPDSILGLTSADAAVRALQADVEPVFSQISKRKRQELQSMWQPLAKRLLTSSLSGDDKRSLLRDYYEFRDSLYKTYRVVRSPSRVPESSVGARVYQSHCQSCHGDSGRGDGVLSQNPKHPMQPPPSDLVQMLANGVRNPFSVYNLLIVGVANSPKQSYAAILTNHELWSVSFWLFARPFAAAKEGDKAPAEHAIDGAFPLDLRNLASLSDGEIRAALKASNIEDPERLLQVIRSELAFSKALPRKVSW